MGNKIYGMCSGDTVMGERRHEWDVGQVHDDTNTLQQQEDVAQKSKSKTVRRDEYTEEELASMKEFDDNIVNYGRIINDYEMESQVSENVRKIESMLKPLNIAPEDLPNQRVFKRDAILFNDGTIYKGEWSFTGKKQGFGIYIKPDGSKYEGMWNNDKIEGIGRYIDRFGNYYEGKINFQIFKIFFFYPQVNGKTAWQMAKAF
jgi:hypothetical protein